MALSLDKIGQGGKRTGKRNSAESAAPAEAAPRTPARPKERPWSQRGLARDGRSAKETRANGSVVSEEWMNLHEAPLFWIDVSKEARLASLQEKLLAIEKRATKLIRKPFDVLSSAKRRLRALIA